MEMSAHRERVKSQHRAPGYRLCQIRTFGFRNKNQSTYWRDCERGRLPQSGGDTRSWNRKTIRKRPTLLRPSQN